MRYIKYKYIAMQLPARQKDIRVILNLDASRTTLISVYKLIYRIYPWVLECSLELFYLAAINESAAEVVRTNSTQSTDSSLLRRALVFRLGLCLR